MPKDVRLSFSADQTGAATCPKSSAPRPDCRSSSLDANGGHCRGQRPALTKSVRAYFISTSHRPCASDLRVARMHLCDRARDRRRCRRVGCSGTSQALPKFESYRCYRNSLNFLTKVSNAYEQFHGIGRLDVLQTPVDLRSLLKGAPCPRSLAGVDAVLSQVSRVSNGSSPIPPRQARATHAVQLTSVFPR